MIKEIIFISQNLFGDKLCYYKNSNNLQLWRFKQNMCQK